MTQRDLKDGRAIVTGASSGIGRALALELARHGTDLVLLARREDRLRQLAGEILASTGRDALVVAGDVTDKAVREQALQVAKDELGGLDLLVNNAGISAHGRFIESSPERLRTIMEVNFFAAADFMRAATPLLAEGNRPMVINIGSVLGRRGVPHTSEYCASKFALHGFSESIRPELARLGIDLLVVAPSSTTTELADNLVEKVGDRPWREFQGATPESVAKATVRAIRRSKHEIVPSWGGWGMLLANRLFPRLVDRMMKRLG